MQNIDLICIGKMNAKYFAEGVAEYQKRLAAFAAFRIIELPEEKIEEKNASDAVVKKALEKEGKAAALRFSMGRITMPHQLARLVLTEQIYRACTINAGMKYHK